MIFTISLTAASSGFTTSFKAESHLVFTDYSVNGTNRAGIKVGTVTIIFDENYDGGNNLRFKTNLATDSGVALTGANPWGGTSTFKCNGDTAIRINGSIWEAYNNGNTWRTVYEGVKGKTLVVEIFFFIPSWATNQLVKGEKYTLADPNKSTYGFATDDVAGNSNEFKNFEQIEVPSVGDGNGNSYIFPDESALKNIYLYGEETIKTPALFTAIDKNENYDLGTLQKVELASIKAWGENLSDNTKISVKIRHEGSKNAFELTHSSSNDSIPYSLYVNNTNTKVENNVPFNPGVTVGTNNTSYANAAQLMTLYAKIDLTRTELAQRRAGSYTDTIYIEISIDE